MNLLEQYLTAFHEPPELPKTVSFNNKILQDLMQEALNRGTPLTEDEVFQAFHGRYDIIKD